MSNGNGMSQQQLDKLEAVAAAAQTATSVADFLTKVEDALQLLEAVGHEVGSAGNDDEHEILALCKRQRSELHAFVRMLVNRYRERAGQLDRILGKTEG